MELMKQRAPGEIAPERTGIPVQMKRSFEARSGLSFDDVRVHYGSDRPARLGALAYTQGSQVFLGPGQERHLAHELGHVVQQKRGLVRPTAVIGGLPLNDDPALERAADAAPSPSDGAVRAGAVPVVQRKVGFEFQTVGASKNVKIYSAAEHRWKAYDGHGTELFKTREGIRVTADGSDVEYITPSVETSADGRAAEAIGNATKTIHTKLKTMCMQSNVRNLNAIKSAQPGEEEKKKVEEREVVVDDEAAPGGIRLGSVMVLPQLHIPRAQKDEGRAIQGMRIDVGANSYLIQGLGDTAHPHATVGVKLIAIPELIHQLSEKKPQFDQTSQGTAFERTAPAGDFLRGLTTNKFVDNGSTARKQKKKAEILDWQIWTLTSAVEEADRAINAAWGAHGGPARPAHQEMRALLAVLVAYNRQYCVLFQNQGGSANAKNAMPIMLRTSLHDIYKHAVSGDQTYPALFEAAFNKIRWVKRDQDRETELDGSITPEEAVLLGDDHEVTVQEWFNAVRYNTPDPIHTGNGFHSVDEIYTGGANNNLYIQRLYKRFKIPGLAPKKAEKDALDIGLPGEAPGVLAELRGLERNVRYDRWGVLAKAVAVMIHNVNSAVRTPAPPPPPPPPPHGPTQQGGGAPPPVHDPETDHTTTAAPVPQQQQQQQPTMPDPRSTLAEVQQRTHTGTMRQHEDPTQMTQGQGPQTGTPQPPVDRILTTTHVVPTLPSIYLGDPSQTTQGQRPPTRTIQPPVDHTQMMQRQGPHIGTTHLPQLNYTQTTQTPMGRTRPRQGVGDLSQLMIVRSIPIDPSQRLGPGNSTRQTQGRGPIILPTQGRGNTFLPRYQTGT